jgi:Concanavalin A-like lectin/glucanases superfamily/Bacterial Ig domain/Kelch motif
MSCHPACFSDARPFRVLVPRWLWLAGLLLAGVAQAGTWTKITNSPPGSPGVMLLLTDGSVMVQAGSGNGWYRLKPDIHGSYVSGTWTTLASMHDTRLYNSLQVLRDGRVFVAGGEYGTGGKTAEVFDPITNTWTYTPSSGQNFIDSVSELLGDGRVMVAPVSPSVSNGTVIYDPVANSWTAGPATLHGQDEVPWIKLPDGSILCVDGNSQSERYIPSLNQWVADANTPNVMYSGGETGSGHMLANGTAFFRGYTHTAIYTPSGTSSPGSWVAGPDIPGGNNCGDSPGAVMTNGNVLFVAGPGYLTGPTSFYEFNPSTATISQVNGPTGTTYNTVPYGLKMLSLPDGSVLVNVGSTLYEYVSGTGTTVTAFQPAISGVTHNSDGSYQISGTNLNGFTEGASYGDDFQMSTNYPIVQLTGTTGNVYYARSFNWSSTALQTGAAAQTTQFTLPLGLPADTYTLVVIASGIVSASTTLTTPYTAGDAAPTVATAAAATPASITSTTTALSVLGADSDGGGESNLTYTWTTTSAPNGVTTPAFSINGSNAAKSTTATFGHAGSYTFVVTITDSSGLSTTSSVSVTVSQTLTGVTVTPSVLNLTAGQTQQLAATAQDQFGVNLTTQPGFTWAVVSGGGSISASGLYTTPGSGTLASVSATTSGISGTAAVNVVSSPWVSTDVGTVAIAGSGYDSGGTFTLNGEGSDIWGTADQFHYVYRSLGGDGTIIARVVSQQNTAGWAKAGVMMRESTAAGAAHAMMVITPGNGTAFQYRPSTGASSTNSNTGGRTAPYWVKLVRSGSTITGYSSPNGTSWSQQSSATVTMTGSTALVGLAVDSANTSSLSAVSFDSLSFMIGANDSINVNPGVAGSVNVLANDTGPSGTTLSVTSFSQGTRGSVSNLGGGVLQYTPQAGQTGIDSFTYTLSDGIGDTATATVNVVINGLQAAYKFDEGSGTTSADGTGDGYTCTLSGATWSTGLQGTGALSFAGASTSIATIPAMNLSTNTFTLSGWVKRSGTQSSSAGIVFCRAGTTVAGLLFGSANELRYNWNNTSATYNYNSGLVMADSQWTYVALVITPTQATIYMQPLGGSMQTASNTTTHAAAAFDGVTTLGQDTTSSTRCYNGALDELRIYNTALNATQIAALAVATPTAAMAASATPAPVSGTSTTLSVLGASNVFAESALTYTWSATSLPGGATAPVFSASGTHAASSSTATFTKAGSYTLSALITDPGGGTTTSSVPVTVSQTPTSVTVAAAAPVIGSQITQQFTATAWDQFGSALAVQPSFAWAATGYGSVSSSGLYTAPYASGTASISASSGALSSAGSSVTASTPWKSWLSATFSAAQAADPTASGPLATPAHDGICNLLKYALNASPAAATPNLLPVIGTSGGSLTFTYRQNSAATDLTYTIEQSTDLLNWTTATPTGTITLSDDGHTRLQQATFPGGTPTLMLRLRVATP